MIDDYDRGELFNCHFASVGVIDNGLIPSVANRHCDSIIDTVQFDDTSIVQAINKLKPNLSSGPDGLPPLLFKRLKFCLAKPMAMLFQQLLSVGYVPQEWKCAIITHVCKKGPISCVANYRPISLTCIASKMIKSWSVSLLKA